MQFAQYRTDLLTILAASYGYNFMALVFLFIIFDNFNDIAGWSKYEVVLLYGVGQLIFYLFHGLLSSIDDVSDLIWHGELDQTLLKPLNSTFMLSLSSFNLFYELPSSLLALAIIIYALNKLNISLFWGIPYIVIFSFISLVLFGASKLVIGYLAFWLTDTRDITRFHWHMTDHSKFPIDIFPGTMQLGLKTIIPTSLVSYTPVYFLTKGFDPELAMFYVFSYILFLVLCYILWNRGLKIYESASK